MLLYYITDRLQFPGSESDRRTALLARIAEAARLGVDYIQLREKDLDAGALAALASEALRAISGTHTRLLINSRTDVALAAGVHGVHLTSTDLSAAEARAIVHIATRRKKNEVGATSFLIGVSCHSAELIRLAESHGADYALLAPIFEKPNTSATPLGLEILRKAAQSTPSDTRIEAGDSRRRIPVIALGGITTENAAACLAAGAAGIAGIRLFQIGDLAPTIAQLRGAK